MSAIDERASGCKLLRAVAVWPVTAVVVVVTIVCMVGAMLHAEAVRHDSLADRVTACLSMPHPHEKPGMIGDCTRDEVLSLRPASATQTAVPARVHPR